MGTKRSLSSAFHPQTDGQTERTNRVLEEMLRHFVHPLQNNWDSLLPVAEFAINNAWQESIGDTPFFLNFGQHSQSPLTWKGAGERASKIPAVMQFVGGFSESLSAAKQALQVAQQRQKAYADKHRSPAIFCGRSGPVKFQEPEAQEGASRCKEIDA
jgi:hypothetical protein